MNGYKRKGHHVIDSIEALEGASIDQIEEIEARIDPASDLFDFLRKMNRKSYVWGTRERPCAECHGTGTIVDLPRTTHAVHPSSVARCMRQNIFEFLGRDREVGEDWEPRMRMLLDTGNALHGQLQGYLEELYGDKFRREVGGELNEPLEGIGNGSCDGVLDPSVFGAKIGFEIKTIGTKGYNRLGARPETDHIRQGVVYQKILNLPWMVYWYYRKDDSHLRQFVQRWDPETWERNRAFYEEVLDWVQRKELPPRANPFVCRRCKFDPICP